MSKKPSRAKRKEHNQKGGRKGSTSEPEVHPLRPAEKRALERAADLEADRAHPRADEPVSARPAPIVKGRARRANQQRVVLLLVGLVAIAGLIAYAAQRGAQKQAETPDTADSATARAAPAHLEMAPPIDTSGPTIVRAPAGTTAAAASAAPLPSAPPAAATPVATAKASAKAAAAPKPARPAAPRKPVETDPY